MSADCLNLSPFILHELPDITHVINLPLKSTQRIKYTCFDISRSLIVFGATSGGVYIFNRNPCEFVQLIPNKDGAITKIRVSQDEKYVAFANGKGIVTIIVNDNTQTLNQSSTQVSREHHGNEVTDMVWNETQTMLYIGDDTGTVSIFQISNFMTKTIFHSSTSIIMHLDSRICQIDVKQNLLLVSTLTRSYVCDTVKERYRQIGQKLRDGEYGACFYSSLTNKLNDNRQTDEQNIEQERKIGEYNVIMNEDPFVETDLYPNVTIYSARPSSRLWEASIDGSVQRTHQFKQILSRPPSNIISYQSFLNENMSNDTPTDIIYSEQAISFPKILALKNGCIFTHKRDGIYFLNPNIIDHTMWSDKYENIIDCRIFDNVVYIWRGDGNIVQLIFVTIESFLSKCYVDEKFNLCAKLCALYMNYLMSICDKSFKVHILTNLKEKLITDDAKQLLARIEPLLEQLNKSKNKNVLQLKSGIYVVGNNYSSLMEDIENNHVESPIMTKAPETLQALKDLSVSVTDKLSSGTKKLWDDLKTSTSDIKDNIQMENSEDIIYNKTSSHCNKRNDNLDDKSLNKDLINESIYKHFRLSMLDEKSKDMDAICHIIDDNACDIRELLGLLKFLDIYINNLDNRVYQANFTSSYIFLMYLNRRDEVLGAVLQDEKFTQYFIEACICVNDGRILKNLGCECGYPLPYSQTSQTPLFSSLIDTFIEKQWSKHSEKHCYAICKGIPYAWRKILYLRRNEDLINILLLMFQMLDEDLLYSCLPQFTIDTWDKAVRLYATIATNKCLNCGRSFADISVQDMLSWNSVGAMMIKSVGGRNAVKILEKHTDVMEASNLSLKFFHTCLMVELYEKFDGTLRAKLTDTLYDALEYDDAKLEICKLLRNSRSSNIKYTALPLSVASKSTFWGNLYTNIETNDKDEKPDIINSLFNLKNGDCERFVPKMNMKDVLEYLRATRDGDLDCSLCSLPLDNDVLIHDGGLWIFVCGHIFHGACLDLCKVKLCPSCLSHGRKE